MRLAIDHICGKFLAYLSGKQMDLHSFFIASSNKYKEPTVMPQSSCVQIHIKFQTFLLVKIDHIHGMLLLGAQKSFDNEYQVTDCPEGKWRAKSSIQFNPAISTMKKCLVELEQFDIMFRYHVTQR